MHLMKPTINDDKVGDQDQALHGCRIYKIRWNLYKFPQFPSENIANSRAFQFFGIDRLISSFLRETISSLDASPAEAHNISNYIFATKIDAMSFNQFSTLET